MRICVLDIESNIHTKKPVVIALRTPEGAVELLQVGRSNYDTLLRLLHQKDVVFVGHYISYDFACLSENIEPLKLPIWQLYQDNRVSDTFVREKLLRCAKGTLDSDDTKFGLSALAQKYLHESMQKGVESWQLRFHEVENIPLEQWPKAAIEYCTADVMVPFRVRQAQAEEQGAPVGPNGFFVNEHEQVRAALALQLMSEDGLTTDGEMVNQLGQKWKNDVENWQKTASKYFVFRASQTKTLFGADAAPDPDPQLNTTLLRRDVERFLGSAAPRTAPTDAHPAGCVRTDADTLSLIDDPAIQALVEMAQTKKLLTSFLPVLRLGASGRIHPRYDILKATGRTSCSNPNIQQLPRSGGVRECFIPRKGYVFIEADYSQIELCALSQVLLNLFGESAMADAIKSGKDLHLVTASALLNRPYVDLYRNKSSPEVKGARQLSKAANFGYPGGMGPSKFVAYARASYGLTITLAQSQALKNAWLLAYPEMRRYFNYVAENTAEGPWQVCQMVSKRLRGGCGFCDGANTLFQGLAADGAKEALWNVAREMRVCKTSPLYGCYLSAFVHDEIIGEAPIERASEAACRLGEVMVHSMQRYVTDVPVKAEPLIMARIYKNAEPVYDANGKLIPWEPKR